MAQHQQPTRILSAHKCLFCKKVLKADTVVMKDYYTGQYLCDMRCVHKFQEEAGYNHGNIKEEKVAGSKGE